MENKRRIEGFALGGTSNTNSIYHGYTMAGDQLPGVPPSSSVVKWNDEPQEVKIPPIAQPKTNPITADAAAACGK